MTPISRRTLLAGGFGAAVVAGVGVPVATGFPGPSSTGTLLPSSGPRPAMFDRTLPVPPVLRPVSTANGADLFRITQQVGRAQIVPGGPTAVWGYNGTFPGPTIISRSDRPTVVEHTNRLPLPTVVHLHGGRTPRLSDGYPADYVYPADMSYIERHRMRPMPGMDDMDGYNAMAGNTAEGRRTYTYPLQQRAATLWYHDHRMNYTGASVWRGLAGFHLIRDAEEDALRLPGGRYELPLMFTDRSFNADGSFRYPSIDPSLVNVPGVTGDYVAGVLGDTMLVNGAPWPVAHLEATTYRLRLLNACNARRLSFRLDPPPPDGIVQIGSDGGLLTGPVRQDHLELAPAERFDLLVNFAGYRRGTVVTVVNDFADGPMGQLFRVVVGERSAAPYQVPDRLSAIPSLADVTPQITRNFRFAVGQPGTMSSWIIGGQAFSPDAISARPRLGSVEHWQLTADFHHPVHLHLSPFQVLARGINGPAAFDRGWKDVIDLRPTEQATIAVRFDGYAGKYVFHCHNLEHEDMGMMANFMTV